MARHNRNKRAEDEKAHDSASVLLEDGAGSGAGDTLVSHPDAAEAPGAPVPQASSSDYVWVALNSPRGIFVDLPGGGRILIKGNADHLVNQERGVLLIGAYGYTRIRREDWEQVLRQYGNSPLFKKGLIFALPSEYEAREEAKKREGVRHGYEPIE